MVIRSVVPVSLRNHSKQITRVFLSSMLATLMLMLGARYVALAEENAGNSGVATLAEVADNLPSKQDLENAGKFVYLSDVKPLQTQSGYGNIVYDAASNGTDLQLMYEGNWITFTKGIWAHASSYLTYDLTNYADYGYLTSFIGLNKTAATSSDGAYFIISTSNDNNTWTEVYRSALLKASSNGEFIRVPLAGAKYLKIETNQNGNNGNDHTIFADARLIKESYNDGWISPRLSEMDEKIRAMDANNLSTQDMMLIMRRELVSRVGEYTLSKYINESEANAAIVENIFNDYQTLELFAYAARPDGTYAGMFNAYGRLIAAHGEDLKNTAKTSHGIEKGYVYRKLMVSLAITHSKGVRSWLIDYDENMRGMAQYAADNNNVSDVVRRYEIYKEQFDNGKLHESFDWLEVEEMRHVTVSMMSDYEIKWFRDYLVNKGGGSFNWNFRSITYNLNFNTYAPYMYEDLATYNGRYGNFTSYGLSYQKYQAHIWNILENGGICWQIANVGQNAYQSYGVPSMSAYQPIVAHVAYFVLHVDPKTGDGEWAIENSGAQFINSQFVSFDPYEPPLGWGRKGDTLISTSPGDYLYMSQAALNDFENYKKSQTYVMMANSYPAEGEGYAKRDELYHIAVSKSKWNYNAWRALTLDYIARDASTFNESDYEYLDDSFAETSITDKAKYVLAKEINEQIAKANPHPMYDLINLLASSSNDNLTRVRLNLIVRSGLEEAYANEDANVRISADKLLGNSGSADLATFSFTGENAGKIMLSSMFSESNMPYWEYCLVDSWGTNCMDPSDPEYSKDKYAPKWTPAGDKQNFVQLSEKDIINYVHDYGYNTRYESWSGGIKVHIIGLPYSGEGVFTIKIYNSDFLSKWPLSANDLENKFFGEIERYEWLKYATDDWFDYEGEDSYDYYRAIEVREKYPGGLGIPGATEIRYTDKDVWVPFTEEYPDLSGDVELKVRIGATGVQLPSSETRTYTFTKNVETPTRQYVPVENLSIAGYSSEWINEDSGDYHYATNAIDGHTETVTGVDEAADITAWATVNGDSKKYIIIESENPIVLSAVEYIPANICYNRQSCNKSDGRMRAGAIYVREDGPGDGDVKAWSEGDGWTLVKEFDFGANGNNNEVKSIEIDASQQVIANKARFIKIVSKQSYSSNGFSARHFNIFQNLDVIDDIYAGVHFDIETLTNQNVVATLTNIDSKVECLAGCDDLAKSDGVLQYTFTDNEENHEFQLRRGKVEKTITATVDWIDKEPPVGVITYSIPEGQWTNQMVVATLEPEDPDEHITMIQDDTWEGDSLRKPNEAAFMENGSFTFRFRDDAGNENTATAEVWWIDTEAPIAEVTYNITDKTNQNVVATLVYDKEETEGKITVTSDGGWTHEFSENGTFTFEFTDRAGNLGYTIAKVDWIDKSAPTAEVEYSTTERTNQPVTATLTNFSKPVTVIGSNRHVFETNGAYTFRFRDEVGNEGSVEAKVTWIDFEAPKAEIEYTPNTHTYNEVKAKIKCADAKCNDGKTWIKITNEPDENTIISDDGTATHTFTENGVYEFTYVDNLGNTGSKVANVTWIMDEAQDFAAWIDYETGKYTNAAGDINSVDVVFRYKRMRDNTKTTITNVRAVSTEDPEKNLEVEQVGVEGDSGSYYLLVYKNGEYKFTYQDGENEYTIVANVDMIVRPSFSISYSKTDDGYVNANLTGRSTKSFWIDEAQSQKGAKISLDDCQKKTACSLKFEIDDVVTIPAGKVHDHDGNTSLEEYVLQYIEEADPPTAEVEFSTTALTNQPVTATLVNPSEPIKITSEDGDTHVFKDNGSFTFIFESEKTGQKGAVTVAVDWIDKEAPTGRVEFSPAGPKKTSGNVVAKLVDLSDNRSPVEKITITAPMNSDTYTFTQNGTYVFKFRDEAGNVGSVEAVVDWIERPINAMVVYDVESLTFGEVTARLIFNGVDLDDIEITSVGGDTHVFTQNGSFRFEYWRKSDGVKGYQDAKVTWIRALTLDDGDADIALDETDQNTLMRSILEDKELSDLISKDSATEVLIVAQKTDEVDVEDFRGQLDGGEVAEYFDISIVVKSGNTQHNLTELERDITLKLEIPEELREAPAGYKRNFSVLRKHGDEIATLRSNRDGNYMVFYSDRFSLYALAYKDVGDSGQEDPGDGGNEGDDNPGGNQPGDDGDDNPGGNNPGGDGGNDTPGGDSGNNAPGGDSGNGGNNTPGGDSGGNKPGNNPSNPGNSGGNSGNTGGDSGNNSGDAGNTGDNTSGGNTNQPGGNTSSGDNQQPSQDGRTGGTNGSTPSVSGSSNQGSAASSGSSTTNGLVGVVSGDNDNQDGDRNDSDPVDAGDGSVSDADNQDNLASNDENAATEESGASDEEVKKQMMIVAVVVAIVATAAVVGGGLAVFLSSHFHKR